MGADLFFNTVKGTNATEAFKEVHDQSCYENGNGGYTGTIAEKGSYTVSKKPKEIEVNTWLAMIEDFDEDDKENKYYYELKRDYSIYDDKWGDALCIPTEDGFIFCGYASS